MQLKGIDVSKWNGDIDWKKVKESGIQFAMIRAGFGVKTVDEKFHENAQSAKIVGLPIGIYWFCYALNKEQAVKEAEKCLETIKGWKIDYPVCYDIEDATFDYMRNYNVSPNPALVNDIIYAFCDKIRHAGYYSYPYVNIGDINRYKISTRYGLWLAHWDNSPAINCNMWQYSSAGQVPGINGKVDMDISYTDYTDPANSAKSRTQPIPTTQASAVDKIKDELFNDYLTIAKEAAAGKYGNGTERKEKILSLGYDYSWVQTIINFLLSGNIK